MTFCDGGPIAGAWMCVAQVADPVTTADSVFEKYGWSGPLVLGIVAMWLDSRRREDKASKAAEARDNAANENFKALNSTLGDLKLLIGRLLERHDRGEK